MSGFLDRLGRRAVRHHWWFIGVWVVAAVAIVVLAGALDGQFSDNFRIPDTQSQEALDLLEQRLPAARPATTRSSCSRRPTASPAPPREPPISASVAALGKIPQRHVGDQPVRPRSASAFISKSGDIAIVTVQFDTKAQDLPEGRLRRSSRPRPRRRPQAGIKVAYGGAVVDYADQPPSGNADLIGLLAAVVILLFAFGSVVAMGLPILTALFGLGVGISLVHVIASFTEIGTVAPVLATMIGLGVGIDYSLFIVTRYRENLATGLDVEAAVGRSVATAGSAVLFAGTTVVIAICGLLISGIPYVARLGYMAGLVVAVMMLAALTLLPAIIGAVGHGIDRWKVPSLIHHPDRAVAAGHDPEPPSGTVWERWATLVARHAWPFAIVAVIILLVIAWPVLSMRLGESDDGNLPTSTTQRQAYDLVAEGFGPGTNGPLLVVVQLPPPRWRRGARPTSRRALQKTPGVKAVLPPQTSPERRRRADRRVAHHRARQRADRRPRRHAPRLGAPDRGRHHRRAGLRGRGHRRVHRHRRPHQQPPPLLHRRGRAALVHPADAGVPLGARAAHRRGDEPAVGRPPRTARPSRCSSGAGRRDSSGSRAPCPSCRSCR